MLVEAASLLNAGPDRSKQRKFEQKVAKEAKVQKEKEGNPEKTPCVALISIGKMTGKHSTTRNYCVFIVRQSGRFKGGKGENTNPKYQRANAWTKIVIGAALEVHKLKGAGLIERIYERCMLREFD